MEHRAFLAARFALVGLKTLRATARCALRGCERLARLFLLFFLFFLFFSLVSTLISVVAFGGIVVPE